MNISRIAKKNKIYEGKKKIKSTGESTKWIIKFFQKKFLKKKNFKKNINKKNSIYCIFK